MYSKVRCNIRIALQTKKEKSGCSRDKKKKKCTQVASTSEEEAAVSINIMFLLAKKRKNPLP